MLQQANMLSGVQSVQVSIPKHVSFSLVDNLDSTTVRH